MKKNKNGMIEIMRFVFCVIIILFHLYNRNPVVFSHDLSFFRHGRIGVEFFFLVSGYLLANSAYRQFDSGDIVKNTAGFMYKKVMNIFPYHVFVFAVDVVIFYIVKEWKGVSMALQRFVSYLPGLFFLQKSGIKCVEVNTIEWYIPAMLVAMTVLYPLVLFYKDRFTKIACPIITVVIIGYLIHSTGQLGGVNQFVFNDTLPKVYVRAFAELCAGVFLYEVVQYFKDREPGKTKKVLLTVIELGCYGSVIFYTVTDWTNKYEAQAFYALAVAVALTFSEKTYTAKKFNNKFVYFLGRFSLPLYLAQSIALNIYDGAETIQNMRLAYQAVYVVAASVIFALITMFVCDGIKKLIEKRKITIKI